MSAYALQTVCIQKIMDKRDEFIPFRLYSQKEGDSLNQASVEHRDEKGSY